MTTAALSNELRSGRAFEVARHFAHIAREHPLPVRRRLTLIAAIGSAAVVMAIGGALVIAIRADMTEAERMLLAFVLLGSVAVALGALFGLVTVLWTAFVYQYLHAMTAREQALEATEQVETVVLATTRCARDADFVQDLLTVILNRVLSLLPSQPASALRPFIPELTLALSRDPGFQDVLNGTFERGLERDPKVKEIVTHVQETSSASAGV